VLFIHNYLIKHLKGYHNELQNELQNELVKVIMHYQSQPPPKIMSLNSPAILVTYFNSFLPQLDPREQDSRMMILLQNVRSSR
jgi:hypothetical protein